MAVLNVAIFLVFAVFSVKCTPPPIARFNSEETEDLGGKEYKEYSGIRRISSGEREFVVYDAKLPWAEARDACLGQGMLLASPETDAQMLQLKNNLKDNDLVPADQYSGYWVGGRRDSGETPFTWQYTGNRVGFFSWLPGEPNHFTGEDCVEFKNDAGSLGLNNLYCDTPRGYICERALQPESMKNNGFEKNNKVHEEEMKYIIFQDLLHQIDASTTVETDSVSNIDEELLDDWETTPEPRVRLPVLPFRFRGIR